MLKKIRTLLKKRFKIGSKSFQANWNFWCFCEVLWNSWRISNFKNLEKFLKISRNFEMNMKFVKSFWKIYEISQNLNKDFFKNFWNPLKFHKMPWTLKMEYVKSWFLSRLVPKPHLSCLTFFLTLRAYLYLKNVHI